MASDEEVIDFMENDDLYGFKEYTQKNSSWKSISFYEERFTLLHLAVCHNKPKFVKWILDAGLDINAKTKSGDTALHLAIEANSFDCLKELLNFKPNTEIEDQLDAVTPLLKAMKSAQLGAAQLLIQSGALLTCKDRDGNTPLLLAIDMQQMTLIDLLLEKKADIEAKNWEGFTAIHMACKRSDMKTTKKLLELGANAENLTKAGESPLEISIKQGSYECVHLILEAGIKIDPYHIKIAKERGSGGMWYEIAGLYEKQQKLSEDLTKRELFEKDNPEIESALQEEPRVDYKDINDLAIKYEKMKEYCRGLLFVKQKLQNNMEELSAALEDQKQKNEKINILHSKEINQLKLKNDQLIKEMNLIRRNKHFSLEDHKISDSQLNISLLINPSEINLLKIIGQGSAATVYKATYKEIIVAVKKMIITEEKPQKAMKELLNETKLLEQIRHPSIILMLGVVIEKPNSLSIVMEYMPNQSLKSLLENSEIDLSNTKKSSMALQIAQAMLYLHNCAPPILHRDLKSSNCLVDEGYNIKLCDFGIAKIRKDQLNYATKTVSTYQYMAPESMSSSIYTTESDVYSFGILLWELWTRKLAFAKLQPIQVVFTVVNENKRPLIPHDCHKEYALLMKDCWQKDPKLRPDFGSIIKRLRNILADFSSLSA